MMRICMLSYSFFEYDNRVRRYADTLIAEGHSVDVVCLRMPGQSWFGIDKGIRVYRIQRRQKNEKGPLSYLFKLLFFFIMSLIVVTFLHIRKRYHLVHVHNPPDFLVFSALILRLSGAQVILDIHDILPELYKGKFNAKEESLAFRFMLFIERISARLAQRVIIANHIWYKRYTSRSADPAKCTVIMNYPDPSIFSPRTRPPSGNGFTFVYPGTLSPHQGLDIAIRAFSKLSKQAPEPRFNIFGNGGVKEQLTNLVASLGLQDMVLFHDLLPLSEIAIEMAKADCGVVPKRAEGFGGEAFSTKILEFMALGVPVIASATEIDRFYFDDSLVLFFRSEDAEDLAEKMQRMMEDSELRNRLVCRSLEFSKAYSWSVRKHEYLSIVSSLVKLQPALPT